MNIKEFAKLAVHPVARERFQKRLKKFFQEEAEKKFLKLKAAKKPPLLPSLRRLSSKILRALT
jgi:hypothetical protein